MEQTRLIQVERVTRICAVPECRNMGRKLTGLSDKRSRWCERHRRPDSRANDLRIKTLGKVVKPSVCEWCDYEAPHAEMIHRDHVLPKSQGGRFTGGGNTQWLCLNCHYIKSREDEVRYA